MAIAKKAAAKSRKKKAPTKRDVIQGLIGQINGKATSRIIDFADQVPDTYTLRRPSGIMQLDIDTGGGLPAGGLSYLSGPDNSGKTYLMLCYLLMHQKLYQENAAFAFAAAEGGFDFKTALHMGIKIAVPDRMIEQWQQARMLRGLPPYTKEELMGFKEQTGEAVIIQGATGEDTLNALLQCIKSGAFGIVCLDSTSILLPTVDADKAVGETDKQASHANLVTQFLKRYTPMTNTMNEINETTVIFSQQVRANRSKAEARPHIAKYMKSWATTGAYAARHGKLIDITTSSSSKIKKTIKGVQHIIGKQMKWEIEKGKAGTHDNISNEAPFIYREWGNGVDHVESIIVAGLKRGVIVERPTNKVDLIAPDTGEVTEIAPSLRALPKLIESDFEFELQIRREILAAEGIECLYR